jgi:hypothetical protein
MKTEITVTEARKLINDLQDTKVFIFDRLFQIVKNEDLIPLSF